jgi:trigger factor
VGVRVPPLAPIFSGPISTVIESPEPWKRVVKASVERSHFDQEYTNRLKKAAKSHQKPGFRKGRTPRAIVEKEMGDLIRSETVEAMVPKAWMTALMEHKLAPVSDPTLENLDFGEEGPLKFDLVVEVRPEIELGNLDGLSIKRREVETTDKDIDEILERLRDSRAEFEKVDRAAAEDDQILLDLIPAGPEGDFPEDGKIVDQRFVLGSPNNMAAFNEELKGCEADQEKTVTVVYPEDHPNETLKGKDMAFKCLIREVLAKKLPELNDEFAGTVAEGKTMADLRDDIRADMDKENAKKVEQEMDRQVQEELVERHDVSLPPSMVDRYLASGLEEMHKRNAQMGRPDSADEDKEYLEAGKPHAEKAIAAMLLLEAVRRQEEIKVTPEDVDERIEQMALENGFDVDRYKEFVNSGEEKERIEYDLLERRTYDFLLSRAEVTEVPADTDVNGEKE